MTFANATYDTTCTHVDVSKLCLSAGLVLCTGRLHGDTQAALPYPHVAEGSRPDVLLLAVALVPDGLQSEVDVSRLESDHQPFITMMRCQCTAQPQLLALQLAFAPHPRSPGTPANVGECKGYVEVLDGLALDDCVQLAQCDAIPQAYQ